MQTNMMPPPLPGHPGAAPAPGGYPMPGAQAQPNPYPGPPAHAMPQPAPAPMPAPAPAPGPYPAFGQGAPAAPAPAPGYGQPAAGYAPAPVQAPAYGAQPGYPPAPSPYGAQPGYPAAQVPTFAGRSPGDLGAAIAGATGGDKTPRLKTGQYVVEVVNTSVKENPVEHYLTFIADLIVLESNNPALPVGSEVSYVEGLTYGAGRVQDFLIGGAGFAGKAAFDQAMVGAGRDPKLELQLLSSAATSPVTQPGNHYQANPLKGRRIRAAVTEQDRIAGPKSRKAGQMQHIINHTWSPG